MPSTVSYPLLSISFDREMVDVTTYGGVRKPDKEWRHIDTNGHLHAFDGDKLPSLEWVVTGKEWVGDEFDGEEYDVGEHRCRSCGEVIEPKYITDHSPQMIPGLATYTVAIEGDEFLLSEDEYAKAVQAWGKILRRGRR